MLHQVRYALLPLTLVHCNAAAAGGRGPCSW